MVFYWLTVFLFKIFAKLFFRLKIEGHEHLPAQGGFILAANHASSLDPFVIMTAVPRHIRWLVIYEYYDRRHLTWILRMMRYIRVENNLPKEAIRALSQGEVVGIFPEGRRSWDGRLSRPRQGAAALARRTSVPVVPVGVKGTFTALSRTSRRFKSCPVKVRIGLPLFFSEVKNKRTRQEIDQENACKIMQAIAELMQE